MKIGIDARMYRSSTGGIGRYTRNLIHNLLNIDHENEYVLFMTSEDEKEFRATKYEQNKNCRIIVTNIPHYSKAEQLKLSGILAQEKLDLMHFLNFNYPVRYKGKFIITVHDLTLFFYPETARQTNFLKRMAFSYVMKSGCKNASKIIAISQKTKDDIQKKFDTEVEKISVVYEAADDIKLQSANYEEIEELKNRYHLQNEPLILSVGQQRNHKNLHGLVEAFNILRKDFPAKLVIVGKPDSSYKKLHESIDNSPEKRDIIQPGFASDSELAAWYKLASVFVFPSFYEGFGLPGLEAMQAGLPVAASSSSCLPEIYREGAIYFDPGKPAEIADTIKKVLQDPKLRDDLINKGNLIAKSFTWQKTAEDTLKVYKEALTN